MPAPSPVKIQVSERKQLEVLAAGAHARLRKRANIILALDQGVSAKVIAKKLKISLPSVSKWRVRWKKNGLKGLQDIPGRGRKINSSLWNVPIAAEPKSNDTSQKSPDRPESPMTLAMIARKAQVSVSTASRALGNRAGVRESTAKQIRALAKTLHYRADPALSALVAYRGRVLRAKDYGTLAVLSARGTDERKLPAYYRLQMAGMRQAAEELGYHLEIFGIGPERSSHHQLSRILYSRGIRGLVVGSLPENWPHLDVHWKHFSAVSIGYSLHSPQLHRVAPDHYSAVEIIYKKLRNLGYCKIGYCYRRGSEENTHFMNLSAYLRCLYFDKKSSDSSPPYLFDSPGSIDPLPWLKKNKFDAIICGWSDHVQAKLVGTPFEVPNHLGLAEISVHPDRPGTSGMIHNERAVGSAAISLLHGNMLRNLRGVPPPSARQTITIDGTWGPGQTLRQQPLP